MIWPQNKALRSHRNHNNCDPGETTCCTLVADAPKSLTSKDYVAFLGLGSVSRLSMTEIMASLAKPSAMMARAS